MLQDKEFGILVTGHNKGILARIHYCKKMVSNSSAGRFWFCMNKQLKCSCQKQAFYRGLPNDPCVLTYHLVLLSEQN